MTYFRSFNRYDLLVVDDLGVERKTDFGYEIVFSVIDQRYIAGKPLIVTTNLSRTELDSPLDPRYKRIYDRILEMSVPVEFSGPSLRPEKAREKRDQMKNLLYGQKGAKANE
jgi:DNA replication protein DnaC